jgi:hypothetical protein
MKVPATRILKVGWAVLGVALVLVALVVRGSFNEFLRTWDTRLDLARANAEASTPYQANLLAEGAVLLVLDAVSIEEVAAGEPFVRTGRLPLESRTIFPFSMVFPDEPRYLVRVEPTTDGLTRLSARTDFVSEGREYEGRASAVARVTSSGVTIVHWGTR